MRSPSPEAEVELLPTHGSHTKPKAVREDPKIALTSNYRIITLAVVVQILPTLTTIVILYLTSASVYWADLGYPHQNSILNGLQFASKFHEILITASLTAIVLHRIRYDLAEASGVPLGFLTSAYQMGSPTYLFTKEFWGAQTTRSLRQLRDWQFWRSQTTKARHGNRNWLPLGLVIAVTFMLAPIVGPASAVLMIPSLDWWPLSNPLNDTAISVFLPLGPSQIWPPRIDAKLLSSPEMLPTSDACLRDDANKDPVCPSAGFEDIAAWAAKYMNKVADPNITLTDLETGAKRYLTSNTIERSSGWAVSSTVGFGQAKDIANFWNFLRGTELPLASVQRPLLEPSFQDSLPMKKPVVQAHCALFKEGSEDFKHITFPTGELRSPTLNLEKSTSWRIPKAIETSAPSNELVDFHWVDMSEHSDDVPLLGAVFVSHAPDGSTAVFPCTILSHWAPVRIWADPRIDSTILQDIPNPIDIVSSIPKVTETKGSALDMALEPISIDMPWAEALNLPNHDVTFSGFNLTLLESSASRFGYLHANLSWRLDPAGGDQALPWLLSTLISMHVADALARVNSGFSTLIHQRGEVEDNLPGGTGTVKGILRNLNNLNVGNFTGRPSDADAGRLGENYADLARTTNSSHNTEILWEVKRFGYGWGFEIGITVILGAIPLLVHALLALGHVALVLIGRRGINRWCGSPGEMVVLGWKSREPGEGNLENTSTGIRTIGTWWKKVKVKAVERSSKSKKDGESIEEERDHVQEGVTTSLEFVLDEEISARFGARPQPIEEGVYYS
ncbi:MAG: hypothetical protein M1833_005543 [Piccolia ochrophora]|nr:MAG: hypothetical protein M1833_005543 [Piccolia ochrophora]